MLMSERNIEKYRENYLALDFENYQIIFRRKKVFERINLYKHDHLLEVGCGEKPLFDYFDDYKTMTIIEPDQYFVDTALSLSSGNKKISIIQGFLEENISQLKEKEYDLIIISGLLHEVENPNKFLQCIKKLCSKNTVIHINVPNPHSFHRILALEMGLIENVYARSENMIRLGINNFFTLNSLKSTVEQLGFNILETGDYFLKPFSHSQMQRLLDIDLFDQNFLTGLYNITKYFPGMGSEIFIDCSISDNYL